MSLQEKELKDYCDKYTSPGHEVLYDLERETYLKALSPQMISGHLQGSLLSLLSKTLQPKRILEIGTFTAYATICLAQGLKEDGLLHTIEVNDELDYIIEKYLKKAGLTEKVKTHYGDAFDIIPSLNEKWDMVFIDAGKKDYAAFYDLIIDHVNPGGIILADNVLWYGKVLHKKRDIDSQILNSFVEKINNDQRVENVLLPIRDGLIVVRKK